MKKGDGVGAVCDRACTDGIGLERGEREGMTYREGRREGKRGRDTSVTDEK